MHSSTSSFERVIPGGSWGRTWLLVAVLFGVAAGSLEITARRAGHRPSIVDTVGLWSLRRSQVDDHGTKTPVVLLGGSRIQLGFVPSELESRYPRYRVIQLAVDGTTSPMATLHDLACDESFRGIVLCAITEMGVLKDYWDAQARWVAHYRRQFNINGDLNTRISCYLHNRVAIMHPALRLDAMLLSAVKQRSLPEPFYVRTFPDRSRMADYSMVDIVRLRKARVDRVRQMYALRPSASPEQWLSDAALMEEDVRRIQGRGGKVVFIRFPTVDEHWLSDECAYPKAQYWDVFARQTSAQTIHFRDFPELSHFNCPDTSHLDYVDAVAFTQEILRIIEGRHIIDR